MSQGSLRAVVSKASFAAALFLGELAAPSVFAQAGIEVTVYAGALRPAPGIEVVVENPETHFFAKASTDAQGKARFAPLSTAGRYVVEVADSEAWHGTKTAGLPAALQFRPERDADARAEGHRVGVGHRDGRGQRGRGQRGQRRGVVHPARVRDRGAPGRGEGRHPRPLSPAERHPGHGLLPRGPQRQHQRGQLPLHELHDRRPRQQRELPGRAEVRDPLRASPSRSPS